MFGRDRFVALLDPRLEVVCAVSLWDREHADA